MFLKYLIVALFFFDLATRAIGDPNTHKIPDDNADDKANTIQGRQQIPTNGGICIPEVSQIQDRQIGYLRDQQSDKIYFVPDLQFKNPRVTSSQDHTPQKALLVEHGWFNFDLQMTEASRKDWEVLKSKHPTAVNIFESPLFIGVDYNGERLTKPYLKKYSKSEATIASAMGQHNKLAQVPLMVFTDPCDPSEQRKKYLDLSTKDPIQVYFGGTRTEFSPYPPEVLHELIRLNKLFSSIPHGQLEHGDLHKRELLYRALEVVLKHATKEDQEAMKLLGTDAEHTLHDLTYSMSNDDLAKLSELPFFLPFPKWSVVAFALNESVGHNNRAIMHGNYYYLVNKEDKEEFDKAWHDSLLVLHDNAKNGTNNDPYQALISQGKVKRYSEATLDRLFEISIHGEPKSVITTKSYRRVAPQPADGDWNFDITPYTEPIK